MKLQWGALSPKGGSRKDWGEWLTFYMVMPALGIFLVVIGSRGIGEAWDAFRDKGTVGSFQIMSKNCHRASCTLKGPFTSDDATLTAPTATMDKGFAFSREPQVGDTYRARAVRGGDSPKLYNEHHDWYWLLTVAMISLGIAFISMSGWLAGTVLTTGVSLWDTGVIRRPRDRGAPGKTGHKKRSMRRRKPRRR